MAKRQKRGKEEPEKPDTYVFASSEHLDTGIYFKSQRVLYLSFKLTRGTTNRGPYRYENVHPTTWTRLKNAPSAGKFFARDIRTSKPYQRMGG